MNPGPWGILIIALVVLLLFGRGKISNMMGEVAGGIKAFRKGMAEDDDKPVAEIEQPRQAETTLSEAKEVDRSKDA
ncbi:twin-arginine translocase TatA/TatE family subunit [Pelagibacterium sediminicola]|uniref:twin-arginine translocase TatA/TatE family subunit n=1 Tax=Pelagibacterium sediminicola TaxID=2248761 RepID=UPI000E30C84D|nr:twin-arginine translocase TatA/TatE family subunit [Pelagibacterium sediminicola]